MKINIARHRVLQLALILAVVILISRLGYLQLFRYDFFYAQSKGQLQKIIKVAAKRGDIRDRNGYPLAITYQGYSMYAVPWKVPDHAHLAYRLAPVLDVSEHWIRKRLVSATHFVWLKRKLSVDEVHAIKAMNLKGVEFIPEEKRVYPNGQLASHVMGFVGTDNQGLGGLEYYYDNQLKGEPAIMVLEGDPQGKRLISNKPELRQIGGSQRGSSISVTIDHFIQYWTETYLAKGVDTAGALSGTAVVMDAKNGDVLAMATHPDFDPNDWYSTRTSQLKNSSVIDVFEPGSTFKIITIASVLEERIATPGTIITVPETMEYHGRLIKEAHEREDQNETDEKSVSTILRDSLNVGTTILADELGSVRFYKYMKAFGFGDSTQIGLPGESPGLLRGTKEWSGVDVAMMSFGQGIAVTAIQMMKGVSAIANDGMIVKPRIIHTISNADGFQVKTDPKTHLKRVISSKTAKDVTAMMVDVVENGTGGWAKIPGVTVAGKTGTAQKARRDGLGYAKGEYLASFIGFFPAEDPKYIIYVMLDTPKKSIYGGTVAAPIFRQIGTKIVLRGS